MNITQQYYGAEIQDVQVEIEVRLIQKQAFVGDLIRDFTFNQKILAQTFTQKRTQLAQNPIPLALSGVTLSYTPIILQRGRGGALTDDPYALIVSLYPGYTFENVPTYNPANLIVVQSIGSISTSPAGNLIEVTTIYNIIVSLPHGKMTATEK